MKFSAPLLEGRLLRRYKRFLADVELPDGGVVTAHVPNSGSMMGVKDAGMPVWLSESDNPARKLKYTLEMVGADGTIVGVNTNHPNALVAEAIADGRIAELTGFKTVRREVKYGKNSRIDVLLEGPGDRRCYVEVKNVHLKRGPLAEFPDAVTARGAKHLAELSDMVAEGHRAVMVYLIQRGDCAGFKIADDIDPAYAKALADAMARGVEAMAFGCVLTPDGIDIGDALPLQLDKAVA